MWWSLLTFASVEDVHGCQWDLSVSAVSPRSFKSRWWSLNVWQSMRIFLRLSIRWWFFSLKQLGFFPKFPLKLFSLGTYHALSVCPDHQSENCVEYRVCRHRWHRDFKQESSLCLIQIFVLLAKVMILRFMYQFYSFFFVFAGRDGKRTGLYRTR